MSINENTSSGQPMIMTIKIGSFLQRQLLFRDPGHSTASVAVGGSHAGKWVPCSGGKAMTTAASK